MTRHATPLPTTVGNSGAYRLTTKGHLLDPRPGTQRAIAWGHVLKWAERPGGLEAARSAVDRENLDSVTGHNLFSWAIRTGLVERIAAITQAAPIIAQRAAGAISIEGAHAAPHSALIEVLAPAYGPCRHFGSQGGACRAAIWAPKRGYMPRGFIGATGALEDVELVLVFAEPGTPDARTTFSDGLTPVDALRATVADTAEWRDGAFDSAADKGEQFHRNLIWFLGQCLPGASPAEVARKVWQTEARLCSIPTKLGTADSSLCAPEYLAKQYALLSHATWIALGSKAQGAMRRLGLPHIEAYAFGRPGCNFPKARPSWEHAIASVKARRP